jgi:hypothetical protein
MTSRWGNISVATVLALVGALLTSIALPARASEATPAVDVEIPACTTVTTDGVPATEGRVVCFDASSSTLKRSALDIPFTLRYSDRASEGGAAVSLFVEQVMCDGQNPPQPTNCLVPDFEKINALAPFSGDVGRFVIKYPKTSNPIEVGGSVTVSRGLALETAAYVSTKAERFDYQKTVASDVVIFDISITYVEVWDRPGCTFSDDIINNDTGTGLAAPTPECNQPNTGDPATDSENYVWQEIAIWTGEALWSGDVMDGMFLNTRAPNGSILALPSVTVSVNRVDAIADSGITTIEILIDDNPDFRFSPQEGDSFFLTGVPGLSLNEPAVVTSVELADDSDLISFAFEASLAVDRAALDSAGAVASLPGSIDFQEVGPKFASGTDLNIGALEIFIPPSFMEVIFGRSSGVDVDDVLAQRVDVLSSAAIAVQELSTDENGLATSPLRGGLLITVDQHEYSAPGFFFSSTAKTPLVSTASPSSGGGFVSQQPPAAVAQKIDLKVERKIGTRVKLDKLRALSDFKLKPGQKVRIRVAKASRLNCRVSSGRVISLNGGECLIRATKMRANGTKSKQSKLIVLNYR